MAIFSCGRVYAVGHGILNFPNGVERYVEEQEAINRSKAVAEQATINGGSKKRRGGEGGEGEAKFEDDEEDQRTNQVSGASKKARRAVSSSSTSAVARGGGGGGRGGLGAMTPRQLQTHFERIRSQKL